MWRGATTLFTVALLLIGWTGVGEAADGQAASQWGYMSNDDSPVKSEPSVRDGTTIFRAKLGESVWIRCQVEDAWAPRLMWFNVLIRGISGWVVDAARRDPTIPILPCGNSRAA